MNKFRFKIKKLSGFIRFSEDKAFTLIELLVVIAIIGTLSTIAFISLSGANDSANDAKKIANLRSLQTALLQYQAEEGGYPEVATAEECGAAGVGLKTELGKFLPNFDFSDEDYFYGSDTAFTGTGSTQASTADEYVIGVTLSNDNEVLNNDVDEATATPAGSTLVDDGVFSSAYTNDTDLCLCDDASTELGYCISS